MSKRNEFAKTITILCRTFGREASKDVLQAYWIVCEELEVDWQVMLKKSLNKFERMPSPKQLLDLADDKPKLNSKQQGIELVSEIKTLVKKFGYTNFEKAKQAASPKAWALVNSLGGWSTVCRSDISSGALYAQARDEAEVIALKPKEEFVQLESKNEIKALGGQGATKKSSKGDSSFDYRKELKKVLAGL